MLYIGQSLEKVKFTTVSAKLLGNILISENIWIQTSQLNKDGRLAKSDPIIDAKSQQHWPYVLFN